MLACSNIGRMKSNPHAVKVIDALGGTAEVARIFNVRMPSVSDWKRDGIPSARVMFLRVAYASKLEGVDLEKATAVRRPAAREQGAAHA